MKLAVAALLIAACSKGPKPDERIDREFHALWATRGPGLERPACADLDAKRARVDPLIQLAADASKVWTHYDRPLPEALARRLVEIEVPVDADVALRCLISDPGSKPAAWMLIGVIGALLVHRAELATDWTPVVVALRLYRDAPAMQYLYFFNVGFVLERATKLAAAHPPPSTLVPELIASAHVAIMPQATLCAGQKEELLAHGANAFYGHLTDLRAELIARYGTELAPLYTEDSAQLSLPSYAVWTAYKALWQPIATECATTPPAELAKRVKPLVAAVKAADNGLGTLLEIATDRIDLYVRLRADEAAFVAALGG